MKAYDPSILNEEQLKVVEHPENQPAACLAGAGSGKTHALTHRVVYLIDVLKVVPRKILVVTFTNKAANELKERIHADEDLHSSPRVTTIHSLALSAIRKNPTGFGLNEKVSPIDDYNQSQIVKKLAEDYKLEEFNSYNFLDKVSYHRVRGVGFRVDYTAAIHAQAQKDYSGLRAMNDDELMIWKKFEEQKTCHPAGTLVKVVIKPACAQNRIKGWVPAIIEDRAIENLKDGDMVVSWRRKDGRVLYSGKKIKVGKRRYNGNMYTLNVGGEEVKMTSDHKVWVKFNKEAEKKYFVYLMYKKELGFRIGKVKFRHGQVGSGFTTRLSSEGGDKLWVLQVCENSYEAYTWEQILSYRYGIPQTTFAINNNSKNGRKDTIQTIFNNVSQDGARKCLQDMSLLEDYPLIENQQDRNGPGTAGRFFKTIAANLIPSIMSFPALTRPRWEGQAKQQIWRIPEGVVLNKIEIERFQGEVYSLEVEEHHTYVANNIIVGNCMSVVDFDDMLHLVVRRGEQDEKWRASIQKMFTHILMDEAQDTNVIQWEFINLLVGPDNRNLMVVGDLSQSIYGFSGASPNLLQGFTEEWRGLNPTVYKLEKNHRSVPEIVKLANKTQRCMENLPSIQMDSHRGNNGEKGNITLRKALTPREIAMSVANDIWTNNQLVDGRVAYKDTAILIRAGSMVRDIEPELVRLRIPYIIRGAMGLMQTEEVRDILSYMRIMSNPRDYFAMLRSISIPKRGVGDATLEKIRTLADEKFNGDLLAGAQAHGNVKFFGYLNLVTKLIAEKDDPIKVLQMIITGTKYKDIISEKYRKDKEKIEQKLNNLKRLEEIITALLAGNQLSTDDLVFQLTMQDQKEDTGKDGKVVISTIHAAKGLEWRTVYVAGCIEGQLPHKWSQSEAEINEERRVFYVACTRAKDNLILCVPAMLEYYNKGTQFMAPSRFLTELGICK